MNASVRDLEKKQPRDRNRINSNIVYISKLKKIICLDSTLIFTREYPRVLVQIAVHS